MTKMTIAFAALMAFGGCKKKNDTMGKLESFQQQMCACKDKACADKVNDDMSKWSADMAGKDDKPDPDMAAKATDVMAKYTECMTKLAGGSMGSMGGDMKSGDMKAGDMSGDMKGSADMHGGDMKGSGEMK